MVDQLTEGEAKENSLKVRLDNASKARSVIQHVAQKTQANLEYHISHLISLALASVWSEPYDFSVKFVQRRNKTECDLKFIRDGEECDPIEAAGGGACDVASFALQVAYLTMKRVRKTMILDEPFAFLHSPSLQRNCSEMVRTLCDKLKIQIIMVSDQDDITTYAHKHFKVRLLNKVSMVEEKDNG